MGQILARMTRADRLPLIALALAVYRARSAPRGAPSLLVLVADAFAAKSGLLRVLGDVVGIYVAVALVRRVLRVPNAIRSTSLKSLKDDIGSRVVKVLKQVPGAREKIADEFQKMEEDLEKSLKQPGREQNHTLPTEGVSHEIILSKMQNMYDNEKSKWQEGWVSGAVYHGGEDHIQLQNEAFKLFSISNPLHPDVWPSVMQFEAEVISMTANMLNGGISTVCGTMTSGGTESILMATKTHRQWAYETLGITEPEVVAPQTAHAGIDKACDILGIKLISVPVDPITFQVNPKVLKKYLTSDTIMIYSSAPQYPHGIIDPIEELSKIAVSHGCGLHVDCCLGGFVLPFAQKLGYPIPKFNFELPGVTSMSVDTHKYGYASKGTSVVLYRTPDLRKHQYFTYPNWPGGLYVTPSTAGSRPGALSAACWASLVAMGEKGFLEATTGIMETQRRIKQAVADTDGIDLCGDPIAMIVAFQSKRFNIYNLADRLHKRGWSLNSLQNPASVHICVTLRTVPACDRFIKDLRECTAECLANPDEIEKGAAVYGMASSMPAGPVHDMLRTYTDVVLKV
mmetsp:Transcript_5872/g.18861  ORF Transcript_5872/g.18861 Transcript_5872/m.18861 type:complete len:569 (-) Transcript_5872:39-1745(-)